jgi:NAD(P)H-quinone oxidoreductase subunit 4
MVWLSGSNSFSIASLHTQDLPQNLQILLLVILLIGLGIKIPMFPFHTWLPDAHVEASTPISMILAGILLKLGTYGLLRFGLQLLPAGWDALAPWLSIWAVVNVLYGSFNAIAQRDMKKMVAFSSIAHMGFILLACAAATPLSLLAAMFQMVSHGLISALMFYLVGVVYSKAGTRILDNLCGLLNPECGLPVVGSLMILSVMASAGTPGMMGFVSEFLVFRGSFPIFPVATLLAMIGTILTSVYFLLMINRVFFGRLSVRTPAGLTTSLPRVLWIDRVPGVVLALLIVLFGLQPNWMLRWSESSTTAAAAALQASVAGLVADPIAVVSPL